MLPERHCGNCKRYDGRSKCTLRHTFQDSRDLCQYHRYVEDAFKLTCTCSECKCKQEGKERCCES